MSQAQTILIVEDNDDDFECTYDAFYEGANFRNPIQRAASGKEALDYLFHEGRFENEEQYPLPGLVLLDLNMPGIEGKSVLRTIRATESLKKIPVIVFTTSNDPLDIEQCYGFGANSYVQKPTTLEKLFSSIRMVRDYWFEISLLPKHDGNF